MSYTQSYSEGEILPPEQPTPAEAYSPEQARRHREYSVWDPRSAPGTYLLLAINVAVYLWMVVHGVSPKDPSSSDLLHYGANNPLEVLNGQWYRLLTATFVHVGLLHLATNMWCLWNLGILGEPLIGPFGIFAVYMLTGIAGNILSMGIDVVEAMLTREPYTVVHGSLAACLATGHCSFALTGLGAGASGAVFGIAGILIVLLSNRRLPFPWEELRRLRRSVITFSLINLVIGVSTIVVNVGVRIDNSAHIGGFVCGLALGFPLVPRMTAGRQRYLSRQKVTFTFACLILSLIGYWIANLL